MILWLIIIGILILAAGIAAVVVWVSGKLVDKVVEHSFKEGKQPD